MQTFLPYPDFWQSVRALDNKRLGNQRKEAAQILNAIERGGAWSHHPATLMWRNYTAALKLYQNACMREWERRGCFNTMVYHHVTDDVQFPCWLGYEPLHQSHRAMLMYKYEAAPVERDYIALFSPITNAPTEYVWPSRIMAAGWILKQPEHWWQTHRVFDGKDPVDHISAVRYGVKVLGVVHHSNYKLIVDLVL